MLLTSCTSFDVWLEQQRCVHTWNDGETTVTATCTVFGENLYTCTKCGKEKTQQTEKKPHTEYVVAQQDATCTETGLTEYVVCTVCSGNLTHPKVLPALGHDLEIHAHVDPTCLQKGSTEGQFCKRCNEWIIEPTVIPALGHEIVTIEVPPTCTTEGYTGGAVCKHCGTVYTEPTTLPMEHTLVDGVCIWCKEVFEAEALTEK